MFSSMRVACVAIAACVVAQTAASPQDRHNCEAKEWFGAARSGSLMDVKACLLGTVAAIEHCGHVPAASL